MTMSESESEGKVLCGELFCTNKKKGGARDREDRKKLLVRVGTDLIQYHHLVPILT